MRLRCWMAGAVWSCLAAGPVWAADGAGLVKRLQGSVTLQRGAEVLTPVPGTPVQVGDRIVTGPDGGVGITMADDSLLSVGPASTLVISDFRFDSTTQEGGFLAELVKGTLRLVTGLIARTQPQNVNVQTRNAVMGVRGTDFIVDARGESR